MSFPDEGADAVNLQHLALTYNFCVGSYELGTAYGHIVLAVEMDEIPFCTTAGGDPSPPM
jgi:hypothetical protein